MADGPIFVVAQRTQENAQYIAEIIDMLVPGAEVFATSSGDECLDFLFARGKHARRRPGTPSAVFLDSLLDGTFGVEVTLKMRQDEFPHVPVVIITSSDSEEDRVNFWTAGVNAYVPVGFDAFGDSECLRLTIAFWTTANSPIE